MALALLTTILIAATFSLPHASAQVIVTPLENNTATFLHMGDLAPRSQVGHIYTTLDLNKITSNQDILVEHFESTKRILFLKYPKESQRAHINQTMAQVSITLSQIARNIRFSCAIAKCEKSLKDSPFNYGLARVKSGKGDKQVTIFQLETSEEKDISKRSPLGDIMSATAVGVSLYTLAQTTKLGRELKEQSNRIQDISSALAHDERQIQENEDQILKIKESLDKLANFTSMVDYKMHVLSVEAYLDLYSSNLLRYCRGVNAMILNQRLTPDFVDSDMLDKALDELKISGAKYGLLPIHSNVSGILTQPISFIADRGQLTYIVHVGLVHSTTFATYKYVPSPLLLPDKRLVIPKIQKGILSINPNEEFLTLDSPQISQCTKTAGTYLCQELLTERRIADSCIGSLFKGLIHRTMENCEFDEVSRKQPYYTQIDSTRLLVIPKPSQIISVYVTCGDEKNQNIQISSPVTLDVKVGCKVSTTYFIFVPLSIYSIAERFHHVKVPNFEPKSYQPLDTLPRVQTPPTMKLPNHKHYQPKRIDNTNDPTIYIALTCGAACFILAILLLVVVRVLRRAAFDSALQHLHACDCFAQNADPDVPMARYHVDRPGNEPEVYAPWEPRGQASRRPPSRICNSPEPSAAHAAPHSPTPSSRKEQDVPPDVKKSDGAVRDREFTFSIPSLQF